MNTWPARKYVRPRRRQYSSSESTDNAPDADLRRLTRREAPGNSGDAVSGSPSISRLTPAAPVRRTSARRASAARTIRCPPARPQTRLRSPIGNPAWTSYQIKVASRGTSLRCAYSTTPTDYYVESAAWFIRRKISMIRGNDALRIFTSAARPCDHFGHPSIVAPSVTARRLE